MADSLPPALAARFSSPAFRAFLALRRCLQPFVPAVLALRRRRGKEAPARMREKLGMATLDRPPGTLVWLHAVGLGEVLALRPLITAMRDVAPDLEFLITSTARSSAGVIGRNLPAQCRHQFLPIDCPRPVARFLDHWRPALAIWAEQDIWPGIIHDAARRGIPLALVNARMNARSFRKRARFVAIYRAAFGAFRLVVAQDADTARHLADLGAHAPRIGHALKPAAEPLAVDAAELARLETLVAGRPVWVAASTHPADEQVALAAHRALRADGSDWLLIIVPRDPARGAALAGVIATDFITALRSRGEDPDAATEVFVADTYGELGLWYRLAAAALVGGSFDRTEGHNPWEALCLGTPVVHGPHVANFRADYARLDDEGLARSIPEGPEAGATLARAISMASQGDESARARRLVDEARAALSPLATELVALIRVGA